jgi:hypothetical protein
MEDVSHYVSLCFDEEVGRIDKRNLKKKKDLKFLLASN